LVVLSDDLIKRFLIPFCVFNKVVKVIDIGLVVLAVVILESLDRDGLSEAVLVVGKVRKGKHKIC
jgi:hypothetical protein